MIRRRYGASPLHLAGHLAVLGVCAYALAHVLDVGGIPARSFLVWFLAGALLHDFALVPSYALLDRLARAALGDERTRRVPAINHIRVPVVLAATLLLVHWPLILNDAPAAYRRAAGEEPEGYAARWLAVCAALFAGSALVYAWRWWRARAREKR